MRIHQPMLFVGLGGTGCKVGAELERRLREELCGPDGTRLLHEAGDREFLPYQLPACLQFVYADLSSAELSRVRREVVPGREHDAAAQRTMRMITDLVPARLSNSADVAQSLRVNLDDSLIGWLPTKESDPKVGPLLRGAGQLPTVGRAVLFETVRRNADTALLGIRQALTDINESGPELFMASGGSTQRTDPVIVFVVFSVAGGTGSGIFYDYLHLIGDLLQRGGKEAQIYPLVLMPSSFDDGQGGGRAAELNAGSALIDLFRLVDDQNAQGSPDQLDADGSSGAVSIRYPAPLDQVQLAANTIQTAFLFGRPVGGVKRDDLARSMVSLMLSLIGAGPTDESDADDGVNRPYQTFADGFINGTVERYTAAETGVGRRGATTSAVAALTTPLAEITDIISSRLLAAGVNELLVPPGPAERNSSAIRQFISVSGLDPLLEAAPVRITDRSDALGFGPVMEALTERAHMIGTNIDARPQQLSTAVAGLAQEFAPAAAAEVLLRNADLFRLQRIVFGHADLTEAVDRGGFRALLEGWRTPPPAPANFSAAAPPPPHDIPKKFMQRLKMTDPAVVAAIKRQDSWYAWRTRQIWNASWNESHRLWDRVWRSFVDEFRAVHDEFVAQGRTGLQQFADRSKDLYKARVGVAYLLPPQDRGLDGFYRTVLARLAEDFASQLGTNPHEGDILNVILGQDGWADAYLKGRQDPEAATAHVRQLIKEAVSVRLRPPDRTRPALVPRMEDLLSNAVGRRDNGVSDADLNRFRQKLAGLVPGGFAPDGHARLSVLFTYPAAQEDPEIERFLRREVALPIDLIGEPEFRALQADSMVVVLLRSAMGITEVPEMRQVIKQWSEAQRNERPQDSLAWRRRLGNDAEYLLMDSRDRALVLHRLLCAAWNHRVVVEGDPASPRSITVELGGRESVTMKLELTPLGGLSSWATLLQAYERWILTDDNPTRRELAGQLMRSTPDRADTSPSEPAPQYTALVDMAATELKKIEEAQENRVFSRDPQLRLFADFWRTVLPAALDQNVANTQKSLLDLREQVEISGRLGG